MARYYFGDRDPIAGRVAFSKDTTNTTEIIGVARDIHGRHSANNAAIIRSPTLMSVQPGTRFGPHEIVSRAGSGGMGGVYRVRRRAARDADRSEGVRWKTRASVLGAI